MKPANSRRLFRVSACLALVGLAAAAAADTANDVGEDVKSLVVLITCEQGGAQGWGAGIIVGSANDRLYIATANHVVQPCRTNPQGLRVQFKSLPGELMVANLLSDFDGDMDLAVLNLTGFKGIDVAALPFDRLGDPSALKRGDAVYALGHPNRNLWRINLTPDKFSERAGNFLLFESGFIAEGHSGGALLNDRGELEGLLIADRSPDGKAIAIDAAIGKLRAWQYPVALRARFAAAELDALSAGGAHSCRLSSKGAASCWGENAAGQLGNGGEANSTVPVPVYGGLVFVSISAGWEFTCAITANGAAYCWGNNEVGQLGNDSGASSAVPVPVAGGLVFKAISAGYDHVCAITSAGAAHCWGSNEHGQLAIGLKEGTAAPKAVRTDLSFKSISAGYGHTCGVISAGRAYCWGANNAGQLGTGTSNDSSKPLPVAGDLTFTSVAAGQIRTCGVTTSGAAYCWGNNERGQLGNGSTASSSKPVAVSGNQRFKSVKTAENHTCGIATSGTLYCWGGGPLALLGNVVLEDSNAPVAVTGEFKFAAVSPAFAHTCGLTTTGQVYCWGSNKYGQLGIGSNEERLTPAFVAVAP